MSNRTNPRMAAPFRDAQTRGKGTEKASHPIFIRPDAFMGLLFMVRNARTIMEFEYAYYTSASGSCPLFCGGVGWVT